MTALRGFRADRVQYSELALENEYLASLGAAGHAISVAVEDGESFGTISVVGRKMTNELKICEHSQLWEARTLASAVIDASSVQCRDNTG